MQRLLSPTLPDTDLAELARRPLRERIRVLSAHWAHHGFGTPKAVHLLYVVKIVAYAVGGLAVVVATTPDIGPLAELSTWWSEPVVLVKLVLFTLLWELLGWGCGSGPLTLHFWPPFGGVLHWARPGTIRLPPWPDRVPLTRGTRRTVLDVALYLAVLALLVRGLLAAEVDAGILLPLIVLLPVLGLRDKVLFLAARAEQYWSLLIVFMFPEDLIAGTMVVMLAVWWGAATSKLNRHFPSVVAVMVANSPLMASRRIKGAMFRQVPDDLRPSRWATLLAHGGTAIEFLVPAVLVLSTGGTVTQVALVVMIIFHLHIISTFPMGVPLEWNVFVIYAALVVFGANAEVAIWELSSPLLIALLVLGVLLGPVLGNLRPDLVSFLPSMRYYAGNWPTTMWLFKPEAYERLDTTITKVAKGSEKQLRLFYDEVTADTLLSIGHAWRAMHISGRILTALIPRAVDDPEAVVIRDGEWLAGFVIGYNFGDGHFHGRQLLEAVGQRLELSPGDLRVITLESQPLGNPSQAWRILDAVDGVIDEGVAAISDFLDEQPWLPSGHHLPLGSTRHPERPTPAWPTAARGLMD